MSVWVPTSNFWANRNGYKALYVIVHGTAGGTSPYDIAHGFINSQGTNNPTSTHYVIGQDGTVVQCVAEKDAAWGNGVPDAGCDPWWNNGVNPNLTTISIEHVKNDTTNAVGLTDAQKNASFQLIKDICERNGIPKRKADKYGGITGHFSISPINRARCPGTYPWQDLFNFIQNGDDMLQITDPFSTTFFVQTAGDRWHCKATNFDVAAGILMGFRKMNGAPRLPVGPEQYDIPGVVYQKFESGWVVYDPGSKLDGPSGPWAPCYLLKLDSPLAQKVLGLNDAVAKQATLQQQLAQATTTANDALAKEQAAQAQVATLQKELDDTKAIPTVDKAAVSADLTTAQTSIQSALSKLQ